MKHLILSRCALALLIVTGSAGVAWAQSRPMPPDPYDPPTNGIVSSLPGQKQIGVNPAPNDYPAYEVQSLAPAFGRAVELHMMMTQSHRNLYEVVSLLREDMARSTEMKEAMKARKDAADAMAEARKKAIETLEKNPRYVALKKLQAGLADQAELLRARQQAEQPQQGSSNVQQVSQSEVRAVADLKLDYGVQASAMEAEVLAQDEHYQQAKKKLLEAAANVRQVREDQEYNLRRNADFIAARTNFFDLTTAYIAADAYFWALKDARDIALTYGYWAHSQPRYPYPYYYSPYYDYDNRYRGYR